MNKKLFIFGAGASFGSDKTNTPPLGKGLFFELQQYDLNGWGKLDSNLSDLFIDDFENGMEYISENYSTILPVLQRAMAKFFFRKLG